MVVTCLQTGLRRGTHIRSITNVFPRLADRPLKELSERILSAFCDHAQLCALVHCNAIPIRLPHAAIVRECCVSAAPQTISTVIMIPPCFQRDATRLVPRLGAAIRGRRSEAAVKTRTSILVQTRPSSHSVALDISPRCSVSPSPAPPRTPRTDAVRPHAHR